MVEIERRPTAHIVVSIVVSVDAVELAHKALLIPVQFHRRQLRFIVVLECRCKGRDNVLSVGSEGLDVCCLQSAWPAHKNVPRLDQGRTGNDFIKLIGKKNNG